MQTTFANAFISIFHRHGLWDRLARMRKPAIFSVLLLSASLPLAVAQNPTARAVDSQQSGQPAQPRPASTYVSPEVHPDGSVTFRIAAPNAKEVLVGVEGKN